MDASKQLILALQDSRVNCDVMEGHEDWLHFLLVATYMLWAESCCSLHYIHRNLNNLDAQNQGIGIVFLKAMPL